MSKMIKKIMILTLGTLVLTFGFFFFIMPFNLTIGGISGIAMSLNAFVPQIPTGIFVMIMDTILYIIAFIILGKSFGVLSIYCSFIFASSTTLLEILLPNFKPLTDDILINLIFGIIISAAGMALVINQGASTGGTDIIAMIIRKYFSIDVGKCMLVADFFVVLLGMYTFGTKSGMYAMLGICINSIVIDKAIAGLNTRVNMMITSDKYKEINAYIIDQISRGSTIYKAVGGFSDNEKFVINTIVSRGEYIKIKNYVKSIDPKAFVCISYVSEVVGEGFTYDPVDNPELEILPGGMS